MFNAPWVLVVFVALLLAVHAAVTLFDPSGARIVEPYALSSESLARGRWITLVTYCFLHADWIHVGLNSAFGLAFGAGTARLFGPSLRGALAFLGFFLTCGALAGLGYAALPHAGPWALVGASGGVSGFMGATARMLDHYGRLGPPWGRGFFGMAASWVIVNLLVAFTPLGQAFAESGQIAWEAHLIGFFAGAILVGLFVRAAGVKPDHAIAL
jgi:membrane associated rhomboid family serine protease